MRVGRLIWVKLPRFAGLGRLVSKKYLNLRIRRLWIGLDIVYWSMNVKTRDYIEPVRSRVSQRLRDVQDRMSDTARSVGDTTNQYVRENPWKTIAIVAIAACLTGWFLKNAAVRD
jgi:ElaB/YqjD/DUF883 family membrane-anchored ribosome-binding protein